MWKLAGSDAKQIAVFTIIAARRRFRRAEAPISELNDCQSDVFIAEDCRCVPRTRDVFHPPDGAFAELTDFAVTGFDPKTS